MTPPPRADVRALLCSVVIAIGFAFPASSLAERDDHRACVARTRDFHTSLGLTPSGHETRLLDVSAIEVVDITTTQRCVRVDVVGAETLELGLELYDDEGALVARDTTTSSAPSVAVCSTPGRHHLALRVASGRGRVEVVVSEGTAMGSSGIAPCAFGAPGLALGRLEVAVSSPAAERVLDASLSRESFAARGTPVVVATEEEGPARARFDVAPGCHAVLVATEAAMDGLAEAAFEGVNGRDAIALSPSASDVLVACTATRTLEVALRSRGAARFAAVVVELVLTRADAPSGLDGVAASRFMIEAARARARGMVRTHLAVASVGAAPLEVSLPAARDECVLVLAAASSGGLALGLVGDYGRLFAEDTSSAHVVHAWHCSGAEGEEAMHTWIRAFSERRRRVVYAIFSSDSR